MGEGPGLPPDRCTLILAYIGIFALALAVGAAVAWAAFQVFR